MSHAYGYRVILICDGVSKALAIQKLVNCEHESLDLADPHLSYVVIADAGAAWQFWRLILRASCSGRRNNIKRKTRPFLTGLSSI
jgi:hypothetical protein